MTKPALSIIIPTHKRAAILRQCLEHLQKQTVADQLEIIVVSDGHDEQTAEMFASPTNYNLSPTTYLEIPKSHQGVARNRGADIASADVCLLIGDDIFLEPEACEKHLQVGSDEWVVDRKKKATHYPPVRTAWPGGLSTIHSHGVLGFTTWDPACGITPVMRWLEKSGWQFGYPKIAQYAHGFIPQEIQHSFTYASHISLPTKVLREHTFRDDVKLYGWEDMEWGLRLMKAGVGLFYEPGAKALHHHHMELEDSLKRMELIGRSAVQIETLAPELQVVPRGWERCCQRLIAQLPTVRGRHTKALLRGMH